MSRTLYFKPYVKANEQCSKDVRLMDALTTYFGEEAPIILDYGHLPLLNAILAACDQGQDLIDMINENNSIVVQIRR